MWRWAVLAAGWLWYLWRVYTLTVNWATFPDMQQARAIWQKRANWSLWLGAAVVNDTLYMIGLIERWWIIAISFAGCFLVIAVTQPFLVTTSLILTMRYRAWKCSRGKDPGNTFLGELALRRYLGPEEKQAYKQLVKEGGEFDYKVVMGLAQEIREQKHKAATNVGN
jgi:hypothetical protein